MKFRNTPEPEVTVEPAPAPVGKGRPTPKRRESEAKNVRPLVLDDRKAAKAVQRQRRDEAYAKQRQAMLSGDDRYLPLRDKGPVRRYARDFIDARWNVGELFMPVAVLMLVAMLVANWVPKLAIYLTMGMYVVVFGGILGALILVALLRRRLKQNFSESQIPKWTGMYAFSRAFMIRPWRMPKPQVKRGQFPVAR